MPSTLPSTLLTHFIIQKTEVVLTHFQIRKRRHTGLKGEGISEIKDNIVGTVT